MESAPRDGTKFLAWNVLRGHPQTVSWRCRGITSSLLEGKRYVTRRVNGFYAEDDGAQQGFTHWAPLPKCPCPNWTGYAPGPIEERGEVVTR